MAEDSLSAEGSTNTSIKEKSNRSLNCGGRLLDLSCPQVMAILNITPDSFSDGGVLHRAGKPSLDKILARAEQVIAEGAAILDVGGESTRPGAAKVSLQEEMDRVLPVVEALNQQFDSVVSVDTSTPELMLSAAKLGAGLLNDVRALQREGALKAAQSTGLPVCLMHMQGQPQSMQDNPAYYNIVDDVGEFLLRRANLCLSAGIKSENILLDPGFGFGKTVNHNLALLSQLPYLVKFGYPVLVGLSRKSVIGKVLGREVDQRLAGSLSLATLAVTGGATIIRAHDIQETVDAVKIAHAVAMQTI